MKPSTEKEKILKMSKEELQKYKWSNEIKLETKKENTDCSYCSYCSNCSDCSDCSNCSDCSYCSDCSDCSYCSNCSDCSDCSDCSYCSYCSDCSNCSNCLYCKNFYNHRSGYYICNIEVTKEEFEKKKKELGI
jgi:hypothetical protein